MKDEEFEWSNREEEEEEEDLLGRRKIEKKHERNINIYRKGLGSQTELSIVTPILFCKRTTKNKGVDWSFSGLDHEFAWLQEM